MKNSSGRTRREFLKRSTIAGAGLAVPGLVRGAGAQNTSPATPAPPPVPAAERVAQQASAQVAGANNRIRLALVGSGQRGRWVMDMFKKFPDNEFVAVCDVYGPHRDEAMSAAGPNAQAYADYRQILDRKDVDAVLIGAPDHWHKRMLIDAVRAGKDVYCEKPVMHSIADGQEMVRAVKASSRVVQCGMQQRSWPHYILGKQIVDSGRLGKISFVFTYGYQNYTLPQSWTTVYPVETSELDWKQFLGDAPDQPFSAEKYVHWRFFWDFGGGILTDLLTHWIDVIQWYTGQPAPKTATTTGELYAMKWQCPDTITAAYEFPGNFNVTFTGCLASGIDDGGIEFRGDRGTLKIDRSRLAFYSEYEKWLPNSFRPEPEIYSRSEHEGSEEHVKNFLDCMRSRKAPNAPIEIGFEAARTSLIGNLALKRGMKTAWDPAWSVA
jgi:predicted dehydrogenase